MMHKLPNVVLVLTLVSVLLEMFTNARFYEEKEVEVAKGSVF